MWRDGCSESWCACPSAALSCPSHLGAVDLSCLGQGGCALDRDMLLATTVGNVTGKKPRL
ncbi:hypothetical protein LZ31DRAFT_556596 [Colletotrichum somersetense]|nr:hypothetical protein LZ31DRAFT_556596 [Colletotrichum somersetense]